MTTHDRNSRRSRRTTRHHGFTLIEVLGAILVTTVVLTVAVSIFINLSNASNRAVEIMREGLGATVVLDRVARDLSGATLLARKGDVDPLNHPWYFTASSRSSFGGSDELKFISRSQRPKVSAYHTSDLAQVAFFTSQAEDGSLTLYRWASPNLPLTYEPSFPTANDERSFILAEGLREILFRFRNEDGEWLDEWDSTQLLTSGQLPTSVEVRVSMWNDEDEEDLPTAESPTFMRQIVLHQRTLDLNAMIEEKIQSGLTLLAGGGGPNAAGNNGEVKLDENGNPIVPDPDDGLATEDMSVADCVQRNLPACEAQFGKDNCAVWSNVNSLKIATFGVAVPPQWGCQ